MLFWMMEVRNSFLRESLTLEYFFFACLGLDGNEMFSWRREADMLIEFENSYRFTYWDLWCTNVMTLLVWLFHHYVMSSIIRNKSYTTFGVQIHSSNSNTPTSTTYLSSLETSRSLFSLPFYHFYFQSLSKNL